MGLQEKLNAYNKSFQEKAPKEILDIMHGATENLKNSGILDRAVKIGDKAPDFALRNTEGKIVRLKTVLAEGPAVLTFYRGKW
jgi:hypothetical protein